MICEDGSFADNVASERYSDVTGYIILNEGYVLEMDMLKNIRIRKDAFLKDTFSNLRGRGREFPPTSAASLS